MGASEQSEQVARLRALLERALPLLAQDYTLLVNLPTEEHAGEEERVLKLIIAIEEELKANG